MLDADAIKEIRLGAGELNKPLVPPGRGSADPAPVVILPNNEVKSLEEAYPKFPRRIVTGFYAHDAASFLAYIDRHAEPTTAVFFNADEEVFTAILDYHGASPSAENMPAIFEQDPKWGAHRVHLKPVTTEEWDVWKSKDRQQFNQLDLSRFLDDNAPDVVEPSGATMAEMARTLEARSNAAFKAAIRLENGSVQMAYDEQVEGTSQVQGGAFQIPAEFKLQMAVYRGGSVFKFPARFRYRLANRSLSLWYEIIRPHKLIEAALAEITATIKEHVSQKGIPLFSGVVPAGK